MPLYIIQYLKPFIPPIPTQPGCGFGLVAGVCVKGVTPAGVGAALLPLAQAAATIARLEAWRTQVT